MKVAHLCFWLPFAAVVASATWKVTIGFCTSHLCTDKSMRRGRYSQITKTMLKDTANYQDFDDYANRRNLLKVVVASSVSVLTWGIPNSIVTAFDGSGSSAYSGRSPATKAELKRQYKERVVADVKDFVALGKAIDNGLTEGKAWINFFITAQRKEPDQVGRTYAALVDLRGLPTKKFSEFEGGDGLLLANTFTKPGKPPDNTPAVRSFLKLSKTFDAIETAGKDGDVTKAKKEWEKSKQLIETYLADVELPGSLQDPMYQP